MANSGCACILHLLLGDNKNNTGHDKLNKMIIKITQVMINMIR